MNNESKEENNLFYTCSLIEYIARITKNTKEYVISKLGVNNITKIYNLADVYHTENIESVADEFIKSSEINKGDYDIISNCHTTVPTYFDIGKVYKRLIIMIDNNPDNFVKNLINVMSSWIIKYIDNYNSSMYYENPSYIYNCYIEGKIL